MTLAASSAYLPLVTLSGRVGSDTPIIGEQSDQEAAIVVNDVSTDFTKSLCSLKMCSPSCAFSYVSAIFVGNSDLLEEGEEQEGCQGIHSGEEDKGERWH